MNPSTYVFALCLFILLPAGLFAVFWFYIMKRGWGSRWLLATSVTIFMALIFIVISVAAQENSILFWGLGFSVLSGLGFFVFLKTSPISDALISQNQQMQSNWASLTEEERKSRNQLAKITISDTLLISFLQYIPLIIGSAIILLSRGGESAITTSLALFVMGFTGILRIILRPKHVPTELYSSKSKIIGNLLITVFAWSLAVYSFFNS